MCKEQYADLIWDHDEAAHKKYKEHLAPIVLFTYNRLEHTKKTVAALQQNIYANDSELYIYSDGARDAKALASIEAVRKFLHTVDGFKSVQIIERDRNWGLAENIIDGVTKIVNSHGKVIVLEDDIVTSRYFLKYMNDALEVYRDDSRIMEVSGYMYPMDTKDLPETFFLKMGDCWGWGTWSRAWRSFERNPEELMKAFSAEEVYHFNLEGAEDFWAQVKANVTGELHTWAVFWMAAIVRHDGLMLCSRESLSQNIGMDGSGEHCGQTGSYEANLKKEAIYSFPLLVAENKLARENLRQFFLHEHKNNRTLNKVYGGVKRRLQWLFQRIIGRFA